MIEYLASKLPLWFITLKVWTLMWSSHLDVYCDDKLDWSVNTDALYKKGSGNFSPGSFNVCDKMLYLFYHAVVACVFFSLLLFVGLTATVMKTVFNWTS